MATKYPDRLKDLKDILSVFDKFKVRAFLSYGAVLGAVRDKDFIEWDDDVDIDVIDPIDFETRKRIGWMITALGFNVQPISFDVFGFWEQAEHGYNGDGETGIIVCERNTQFSIFFYRLEGDEYVCTPRMGGKKLISNLKKFYDKPEYVKLNGEKFLCPGPVKEYLEYMYGDWKTPKKDVHAPQFYQRKK